MRRDRHFPHYPAFVITHLFTGAFWLNHIWSPWRMVYIENPNKEENCVFCTEPARPECDDNLLPYLKGERCQVYDKSLGFLECPMSSKLEMERQWKSWVARGAYIMVTFTAGAGLWWLLEAGAFWNILSAESVAGIRNVAAWVVFPFALGVVIYTAFLLGQAEGRDMWQSNLLPFQLLSQSMMVTSGIFLALGLFVDFPSNLHTLLVGLFPSSIAINLLLALASNFNSFASEVALLGYREMTHGRFRNHYWWGGIALGHIVPLVLIITIAPALPVAVLATLVGLFFYE